MWIIIIKKEKIIIIIHKIDYYNIIRSIFRNYIIIIAIVTVDISQHDHMSTYTTFCGS